MDSVEPGHSSVRDEFAARYKYPGVDTVALKKGISIQDVQKGVEIEFKEGGREKAAPEVLNYMDNADVLNHLNYDCLEDDDSDLSPFERIAQDMEKVTEDGGVLKKVMRHGAGSLVAEGATCRVHYNGYLEYSEEPFDSSRLRDQAHMFRLGQGECLPGWQCAVETMRKGETARFIMKPEYCYGKMGCPPRIPPNATMLFEIELVQFMDHKVVDDFVDSSISAKQSAPLEQILAVINAEREAGNDFYARKMIGKALVKYGRAINLLENVNLHSEQEEQMWKQALLKLYLNTSLCCIKLNKSPRAISYCRKILEFESKNVKALFRLGQAHMQLGELDSARGFFVRAQKVAPSNRDVSRELRELEDRIRESKSIERETCRRMFGNNEPVIPVHVQSKRLYTDEMYGDVSARCEAFAQSALNDLSFPVCSLDEAERQCMEHVCEKLRLQFRYSGEGDQESLTISKSGH